MKKILFFGNSLTAGFGLANVSRDSLPSLIKQKIDEEKLSFDVLNAGVSGDTSPGGLKRLDYWMSTPCDIFILELGINDFLRGLPISSTYRNLDEIIKKVKNRYPDCKVVVMGMEVPNVFSLPKVQEFKNIFRRLAEQHNAVLIPFLLEGVAGVKHLNLNDGIHPSHKGYQVIAERIWPTIRRLVKEF